MRLSRVLWLVLLALFTASLPAAAEPILTIGEFQWDDDGSGLGPIFTILNYSDAPSFATGPIPSGYTGGEFTDVVITVDGTATALDDLAFGNSVTFFGSSGTLDALLGFSFRSQQFSLLLTQNCGADVAACVAVPDEFGEQHATRLIDYDAQQSPVGVPEPSTLTLFTVGLACATLRRRRHAL